MHASSVVLNSSCLMIRLLPVLLVWRGGLWKRRSDTHWSGKPWGNLSPRYVDNKLNGISFGLLNFTKLPLRRKATSK